MHHEIKSIAELIDELGGPSALGVMLGITQEAVSMWKARENIPPGWHWRLEKAVLQRGKTVNPAVFGRDPDDGLVMRLARVNGGQQASI